MSEKKLFSALVTEASQSPLVRKYVKAHSVSDVKLLIQNTFANAKILSISEVTDVAIIEATTSYSETDKNFT